MWTTLGRLVSGLALVAQAGCQITVGEPAGLGRGRQRRVDNLVAVDGGELNRLAHEGTARVSPPNYW